MDEVIHFDENKYAKLVYCEEVEARVFNCTSKELDVTCPRCLAKLWIFESEPSVYNRYLNDCRRYVGPSRNGFLYNEPWEFLARSENEDLFWLFVSEKISRCG